MPKLRVLHLWHCGSGSANVAAALFGATRWPSLEQLVELSLDSEAGLVGAALAAVWRNLPRLRALTVHGEACEGEATPAALAAAGWRLEKLNICNLGRAEVTALAAAPTFALREITISSGDLGPAALRVLAAAVWPIEEVEIFGSIQPDAECGPPLATLARHAGLRELVIMWATLAPGAERALLDASWPALTKLVLSIDRDREAEEDDFALLSLGHSFAGFPRLEVPHLSDARLGIEGMRIGGARGR
jgi:hypothetical protein